MITDIIRRSLFHALSFSERLRPSEKRDLWVLGALSLAIVAPRFTSDSFLVPEMLAQHDSTTLPPLLAEVLHGPQLLQITSLPLLPLPAPPKGTHDQRLQLADVRFAVEQHTARGKTVSTRPPNLLEV